jgi:hypothetical protein
MATTFDATLKDMGRQSPQGFLAAFDRPPTLPVKLLNVDLSTVTTAADPILGLGDPLEEIVHLDFQSSAAAWKHPALMLYNALLHAHYHVGVHTIVVLLLPQAGHANMSSVISHAPCPGRGSMTYGYEIVRLWERPPRNYWPWTWVYCPWPCSAGCPRAERWKPDWPASPVKSSNVCRRRPRPID